MKQYLVIRRLHVHAANTVSGPLTYGLPSITAFLGFGHALQRHLTIGYRNSWHSDFQVAGVGVVVHSIHVLDHREKYERTFSITANPVDEKGKRPAFVEEGRCHMTVSMVMEVDGVTRDDDLLDDATAVIHSRMKLAGGDIPDAPRLQFLSDDRRSVRSLMPGYALLDRRDILRREMENQPDHKDGLDALHRCIARFCSSESLTQEDGTEKIHWRYHRHQPGWIVPMVVGYQAISPIAPAGNARDPATPHRFAEAVTSLGEFMMASRLDSLSQLIWRYQVDGDLYLAAQDEDKTSARSEESTSPSNQAFSSEHTEL